MGPLNHCAATRQVLGNPAWLMQSKQGGMALGCDLPRPRPAVPVHLGDAQAQKNFPLKSRHRASGCIHHCNSLPLESA